MSTALAKRLDLHYRLHDDLAATLGRDQLASKLGNLRSNTMGQQLQCVVGVREMMATMLRTGENPGFHPSLQETDNPEKVRAALTETSATLRDLLGDDIAPEHEETCLPLLEHEAAHLGQLLRYVLGMRLEVPASWTRYFDL
jgi:hypothetical protein